MKYSRIIGTALALTLGFSAVPAANATTRTTVAKTLPASYNFTGKTVLGKNFTGLSLRGKPTVLWFWAPWCTVCRGESPDLRALSQSFKGEINLVGVAGLGPVKDMKGFIKDTNTGNISHLADVSGEIWNHFQIVSQPSFVFISKSGVASRIVGAISKSELFAITKDLIKKT